MAYKLTYTPLRKSHKIGRWIRVILLAFCFSAVLILTLFCLFPLHTVSLLQAIYPYSDISFIIDELNHGDRVFDTFYAFCEELIDG